MPHIELAGPIVVAVVGAVVYALSANGKVMEIGRSALWAGLIGFCVSLGR